MKRIAVIDLETDPFEYNKMVHPFAAGFYDGKTFTSFWGDDCVARVVKMILALPDKYVIYAHNGGRFDFFYFIEYLQAALRIVNNRIIQAYIGTQELRDSYAIMPFALEVYRKTPIDYDHFKRGVREKYRDEILSYLGDDCRDLHTLCIAFHQEFGDHLTIGGASFKQLRKFHQINCGNEIFDARMRKDFYFGGRNQCFKTGIIQGPVKIYDVNSMYSKAMRDFLHPVSTGIYKGWKIDDKTCFVRVQGKNYGAFPTRMDDGSLSFTVPEGEFCPTIHEYQAALETGTFKPTKLVCVYGFSRRESFEEFVDHFSNLRVKAKEEQDKIRIIFYKYALNAPYGKFAQNPENYADWYITRVGEFPPQWHDCDKTCTEICRKRWSPSFMCDNYIIWERPVKELNYYNVATGASITGAARSILLRGLHGARDPYYCDTDSIICRSLTGVPIHATALGAWKIEAEGNLAAICGKKLYAVFQDGIGIKKAHKGARLEYGDILKIARGATIESCNPVPNFKWDGSHRFTKRSIKRTA
jgi:hypothetical protein